MKKKKSLGVLVAVSGALGAMFGTLAGSAQTWINVIVGGAMALVIYYLLVGYFKD